MTVSQNQETGQVVAAMMVAPQKVTSVTYLQQKRDLPDIKVRRVEYQDIHSQVLQDVLLRLERAFKNFFRRIANGQTPGFPRFQGRDRYNSFTYPQGGYSLTHDNRVCLSTIGSIKVKLHRPIEGTSKTCTIKYEAGAWYVVFSCEVEATAPLPAVSSEVGIDLGITHFAALSDGTFIESPRYYRKVEKILDRRQQALSRKRKGSHRREKARKLVAKAHRKIKNQRRDFLHKQSRKSWSIAIRSSSLRTCKLPISASVPSPNRTKRRSPICPMGPPPKWLEQEYPGRRLGNFQQIDTSRQHAPVAMSSKSIPTTPARSVPTVVLCALMWTNPLTP